MKVYQNLFDELERQIRSTDDELADWSLNYLNQANKKRYINDIELIKKRLDNGEILEIGSAPYHLTYLLNKLGYEISGVDIEPERHSKFIKNNKLNIIKCNIEDESLPFEDDTFKYIIFNEVFEHLRINPLNTLRELNRILHPEGFFSISTPNLYGIQNIIRILVGRGIDDPYEEFLKLETLGHMGHVRIYSVKQLRKFLINTGFHPIETQLKTFNKYNGLWKFFILFPVVFPSFNQLQIHICKKS